MGARPSAKVHLNSDPLPLSLERTPLWGRHLASLDGGLEAGLGPGRGCQRGKDPAWESRAWILWDPGQGLPIPGTLSLKLLGEP